MNAGGRGRALRRVALPGALLLLSLLYLLPFLWMVSASIRGEGTLLAHPADLWPHRPTFANYRDVLASGPMARYFLNSTVVAAAVVAGNVFFAPWVAFVLARRPFRGRRLVAVSVAATLMVPRQVTMVPLYLMMVEGKLIDTYGALILPFLVDAFSVLFLTQFLRSVPRSLDDAARVDGAGDWGILFRVLVPILRPALAVVAIQAFLTNWNSFLYPLILTSRDEMRTLPVGLALFAQGRHSVDWGHLMAGATLAALPTLLVFAIFQRRIVAGLTQGALKG
jgi:multiple sugar transport system permease protein